MLDFRDFLRGINKPNILENPKSFIEIYDFTFLQTKFKQSSHYFNSSNTKNIFFTISEDAPK